MKTLEEAAENFWLNDDSMTDNDRISYVNGFVQGARWQMERSYSEEDMKSAFLDGWQLRDGDLPFPKAKKKWLEQFKKE